MADPFKEKEKSLEETATWAVAVVCFVLIVISLFIERLIDKIGTWLKQKHKGSLYEALEKVKADQDRFRLAKDTSFRRRHLSSWSNKNVTLWTVCFFRQFFGSVTEVDYKTLRLGFIAGMKPNRAREYTSHQQTHFEELLVPSIEAAEKAHFAPGSGSEKMPYDFFNYIQRTLEKDFKTVVEIRFGSIYLVVLIVGTKLQVIITKLGLRIQEKSDVVRGAPVVQPGDDLFWFDNPNVMLFLIHLVLFIVRRLNIPMGTRMKPTVFNKRVSKMLNKWHHKAQKETQHGRHSESNTPTHDSSPIHLLHNSNNQSGESFPNPRSPSHSEHHDHRQFYDPESQQEAAESSTHLSTSHESASIELPTIRPANA
ncbi:hypothetical protein Bca4012_093910 [Brassica carinata]